MKGEERNIAIREWWPLWTFLLIYLCTWIWGYSAPESLFPNHLPPFSQVNGETLFLGTTLDGKSMFHAIMYGGRMSLGWSLATTASLGLLGICVGGWMSFLAGDQKQYGPFQLIGTLIGFFLGAFYGFVLRKYDILLASESGLGNVLGQLCLSLILFLGIAILFTRMGKWLDKKLEFQWAFSWEEFWLWALQVLDSLPVLLLIITLAAVFQERSIGLIMALIALTSWVQIALLTRGLILKERDLPYIEASTMLGYSRFYIFRRHLLPNIMPAIFVVLALTIGRVIVAESSLGFLGLVEDMEGLGKLLSISRPKPQYPWLGILPGIFLIIVLLLIHVAGERLKLFGDKK
ncbi:MAG: ABC transporter permease subunit [Bacteroidota bacterium]